jgi:hypothetical protein
MTPMSIKQRAERCTQMEKKYSLDVYFCFESLIGLDHLLQRHTYYKVSHCTEKEIRFLYVSLNSTASKMLYILLRCTFHAMHPYKCIVQ